MTNIYYNFLPPFLKEYNSTGRWGIYVYMKNPPLIFDKESFPKIFRTY